MELKLDELKDEFVNKIAILDNLWKDINYYEDEGCSQNISDLRTKIFELLDERINISLSKKNELLEEINKYSKEVLRLSDILGFENQLSPVSKNTQIFFSDKY